MQIHFSPALREVSLNPGGEETPPFVMLYTEGGASLFLFLDEATRLRDELTRVLAEAEQLTAAPLAGSVPR